MVTGDDSSASPVYQEAFFDPDVLVEWDTVDTVRLFRKVSRGPKALPRRGPPSIEMKIESDSVNNERGKARVFT